MSHKVENRKDAEGLKKRLKNLNDLMEELVPYQEHWYVPKLFTVPTPASEIYELAWETSCYNRNKGSKNRVKFTACVKLVLNTIILMRLKNRKLTHPVGFFWYEISETFRYHRVSFFVQRVNKTTSHVFGSWEQVRMHKPLIHIESDRF
jgi:hypothetical protein